MTDDKISVYRVDVRDEQDGSEWYGFWAADSEEDARAEAARLLGDRVTGSSGPWLQPVWKVVNR